MRHPHDLTRDELLDELALCEEELRLLEAAQHRLWRDGGPSAARPELLQQWESNEEKTAELRRYLDRLRGALAAYPPR